MVDGVSLIGQYQVVAVNRSSKHGLETGPVLAIDRQGRSDSRWRCREAFELRLVLGKNLKLPDERAGTLLVFDTNMSFGLIVSTSAYCALRSRSHSILTGVSFLSRILRAIAAERPADSGPLLLRSR